jgi:hypothetical protein
MSTSFFGNKSLRVSIAVLTGLVSNVAMAADGEGAVKLKNIAAKVIVTPEARSDVSLSVYYGSSKLPKILVRTDSGTLVADGQLDKKSINCYGSDSVKVSGHGRLPLSELPTIIVKVPMDAKISVSGASFGKIGPSTNLSLATGGCGQWDAANIANNAKLAIGGSGTVRMGNASAFELAIGGSGDIYTGATQSLKLAIGGSGKAVIGKLNGPAKISIGGSGEGFIKDGLITELDVAIAGSGDVVINAEVKDIKLSVAGSGDVRIAKHTGSIKKSIIGSGGVKIGPVTID